MNRHGARAGSPPYKGPEPMIEPRPFWCTRTTLHNTSQSTPFLLDRPRGADWGYRACIARVGCRSSSPQKVRRDYYYFVSEGEGGTGVVDWSGSAGSRTLDPPGGGVDCAGCCCGGATWVVSSTTVVCPPPPPQLARRRMLAKNRSAQAVRVSTLSLLIESDSFIEHPLY